ncbi:MAG: hypothetical protein M1136_09980 [Chloroflexi bacterium]|nr:hypothetical protein [Chloroflexota bacterium]MCL5075958.1 hypothetical protein [Chloroflexota bacterium]
MIRASRPTDLMSYLALRRKVKCNEALTRPEPESGIPTIRGFLSRSLSLGPLRECWVQVQHGRISGLIGARARIGTDVWDIDQLLAEPTPEADVAYAQLLEHLCKAAAEDGVERVFLRIRADSPVAQAASGAGFTLYSSEYIYWLRSNRHYAVSLPNLRRRNRSDYQAVFRLYCATVPAQVRQFEGMTLYEWRRIDSWGTRPAGWPSLLPCGRTDFVLEQGGTITAWLQIYPQSRCLILLLQPQERATMTALLHYGLNHLGHGGPVVCPVHSYQGYLRLFLEEEGFELIAEHALFAKALVVRVPERRLMPVRA